MTTQEIIEIISRFDTFVEAEDEAIQSAVEALELKQQLDELGLKIEEIKGMKEISIKGENHPCIDCKFNQPHLLGCPYLCKELYKKRKKGE